MDDLEGLMKKIEVLREDWLEKQTDELADELQWQLTKLKLTVGIENFERLDAFEKLLNEISKYFQKNSKNIPPHFQK